MPKILTTTLAIESCYGLENWWDFSTLDLYGDRYSTLDLYGDRYSSLELYGDCYSTLDLYGDGYSDCHWGHSLSCRMKPQHMKINP